MIRVTFCFSLPGSVKCLEIYRGYFWIENKYYLYIMRKQLTYKAISIW